MAGAPGKELHVGGERLGMVQTIMEYVSGAFEGVGVVVIVGGFFVALARAVAGRRAGVDTYTIVRGSFGRAVLLGLEILVAADLIRTVTVTPTVESLLVLGLLVLIRTFLSFSFEIELEGVVPWKRYEIDQGEGKSA